MYRITGNYLLIDFHILTFNATTTFYNTICCSKITSIIRPILDKPNPIGYIMELLSDFDADSKFT